MDTNNNHNESAQNSVQQALQNPESNTQSSTSLTSAANKSLGVSALNKESPGHKKRLSDQVPGLKTYAYVLTVFSLMFAYYNNKVMWKLNHNQGSFYILIFAINFILASYLLTGLVLLFVSKKETALKVIKVIGVASVIFIILGILSFNVVSILLGIMAYGGYKKLRDKIITAQVN